MVRTYKRKSTRQEWDQDNMARAIEAVVHGNMGYSTASTEFNVPRTTLQRRVIKYRGNPDTELATAKGLGNFRPVFNTEQEDELVQHVQELENRLFGLTTKELRKLAFDLAEKNNINHNFNKEEGLAGEDWLRGFFKRHPTLSLRKPEPTSAARAMGFNRSVVNKFYDLLTETVEKYKITPDRLFNVDETGVTTVAKSLTKIVATKGKKQVGSLSSAERGKLLTVELCMGADGSYMPPLFIYPRRRMKIELLEGCPPGSWGECSPKGWIDQEIFIKWFKKFIGWSRASKQNRVLLLMDGHAAHTKSLKLIELARENGVILLCFPPHTTHKLQPLDVSFMKPVSSYYSDEVKSWLRTNPGRVVTHWQVASIFGKAYLRAATMATAINGYRKSGIWPVNRDVWTDADFLPADTTDIEWNNEDINENSRENTSNTKLCCNLKSVTPNTSQPGCSKNLLPEPSNTSQPGPSNNLEPGPANTSQPGPSKNSQPGPAKTSQPESSNNCQPGPSNTTQPGPFNKSQARPSTSIAQPRRSNTAESEALRNNNSSFKLRSPQQILSTPKVLEKKRIARKRGKTAILTDSPYKNELKELQESKEKRQKIVTKDLFGSKPVKTIQRKREFKKKQTKKIEEDSEDDSESDAECLYCGYLYSQSEEGWIVCQKCRKWAHCSCAGEDEEDEDIHFECENCTQ